MKSLIIAPVALARVPLLAGSPLRFVPPPVDVMTRAAAFEGDADYFFQNASELFRPVRSRQNSEPLPQVAALMAFPNMRGQHGP